MIDPVTTVTGETYDRSQITRWLAKNNTDPASNRVLTTKKLTPNLAIRRMISEWKQQHVM
jgi:hypothetical protein